MLQPVEPLRNFTLRVYREYGVAWILQQIHAEEDRIVAANRRLELLHRALEEVVDTTHDNM